MNSYYCQVNTALLDISYNCNAKCPFCSRQHLQKPLSGVMEPDIFYDMLEKIKKIPSIRAVVLAAAGEPLMNPYFKEYVSVLKKHGFMITCITNMSLARNFIEDLLKCDTLMLSIEGWDKKSYEFFRKGLDFEKVKNNMEYLDKEIRILQKKNQKIPLRLINLLLTKKTDFNVFLECWSDLTDQIRVDVMFPANIWDEKNQVFKRIYAKNLQDYYFKFKHVENKLSCMQPFDRISVRANGDLVPCCTDFNHGISYGKFTDLLSFYYNKQLISIRKDLLNGNSPNICKLCHLNLEVDKEEVFAHIPALSQYKNDNKVSIVF